MSPIIQGTIKEGKFFPDNKKLYSWQFQALEGKKVDMIIKKHVKRRSLNQNRLYWLYLNLIQNNTGNDANDLHDYFKRVHLPPRFIKVFGKEIKIPASTTKLDTKEFTDYIAKIENECGIMCPNPNEINLE